MPYVMRGPDGHIMAVRPTVDDVDAARIEGWSSIDDHDPEYVAFLEKELQRQDPFRESDIHLARVLEDLISLLIDKQIIRFTDFPAAARVTARRDSAGVGTDCTGSPWTVSVTGLP